MEADECPDAKKHTPMDMGYMGFHSWAARKSKTHRQTRCPTCKLWVIWVPKKKKRKPR